MFPIITVTDNAPRSSEQLGSKPKFWYDDETLGLCLFKEIRPDTGEDWAEMIAAYLCEQIAIPHASYHLAEWQGKAGVITTAIQKESERLFLGNELLAEIIPDYGSMTTHRGVNRQHTLDNVLNCLSRYPPPADADLPPENDSAAEAFLGYLMLDALIGNTDRHHENWGCIANENGTDMRLAPSYDHASSLGRELRDDRHQEMLTTRDKNRTVEAYCQSAKSRSALYHASEDPRPLSMVEAFRRGAERFPEAARGWIERMARLSEEIIRAGFVQIPVERISEYGAEFGVKMIQCNQKRLQEG